MRTFRHNRSFRPPCLLALEVDLLRLAGSSNPFWTCSSFSFSSFASFSRSLPSAAAASYFDAPSYLSLLSPGFFSSRLALIKSLLLGRLGSAGWKRSLRACMYGTEMTSLAKRAWQRRKLADAVSWCDRWKPAAPKFLGDVGNIAVAAGD